ncbi:MAG TPA: prephenate dehydratase [Candidatus Limnocylindria bacterium]|nr:prephenate dehydratase [Candidatus Limnocylindria bacterium]
MPRSTQLGPLRKRIDRIDDQLLRLLNRRAALALEIAARKAKTNALVYAPGREKGVLERILRTNGGPLRRQDLRAIFTEIISASRGLEQTLRVAYFGPEGTYTHLAARRQFGSSARYVPVSTIADVFREVEARRAQVGVVPVENSSEGMVAHTLDLLVASELHICAEIALAVRHCLLARRDTGLRAVREVAAHPQALAQCRRWLAAHLPGVRLTEEASNARATQRARRERGVAAIAAAEAGALYGLVPLAEGIQDEAGNVTRFLVLRERDADRPTGDDKTSIVVTVRDEVGVLARLLQPFARHGIDLIKIESRPLRERPWEYYFFLDLKGHRRQRKVAQALAAVARRALSLRVLGSYPAALGNDA